MATNYQRGVDFERELIKLLTDNGFACLRGAGSKGSVFGEKVDIVATKETPFQTKTAHLILIQCKTTKKK